MSVLTQHPTHTFGTKERYAGDRRFPPLEKTANYTLLETDSGKAITNKGSSADLTFTLPAPKPGLMFAFVKYVIDKNIAVTTNDSSVKLHGASGMTQGVTLTNSTDTEYGTVILWSDGNHWYTLAQNGTWAVT